MDEPLPRYAHQVVYDEGSKTVYMHGGNAGLGKSNEEGMERGGGSDGAEGDVDGRVAMEGGSGERRLDDFWSMTLSRYGMIQSGVGGLELTCLT